MTTRTHSEYAKHVSGSQIDNERRRRMETKTRRGGRKREGEMEGEGETHREVIRG